RLFFCCCAYVMETRYRAALMAARAAGAIQPAQQGRGRADGLIPAQIEILEVGLVEQPTKRPVVEPCQTPGGERDGPAGQEALRQLQGAAIDSRQDLRLLEQRQQTPSQRVVST